MAYQDLHQIKNERIRNAFRHVGTLIAMAVTRPDADELAGEFPVMARPERLEELEEVDGVKPEYIPVRNPIEHLLTIGHRDQLVTSAALTLFSWSLRHSDPKTVQAQFSEENQLLVDVMHGLSRDDIDNRIFGFVCPSDTAPGDISPEHGIARDSLFGAIRSWFDAHLERRAELTTSIVPASVPLELTGDPPFCAELDAELVRFARDQGCWRGLFDWVGHGAFINSVDSRNRDASVQAYCERARRTMWCLLILCEGLGRERIETPSGQLTERKTKRYVLHGPQSQADAVNELAGKLVSLDRRSYIAHVKRAGQHHEVKLNPPPKCDIDPELIAEVRKRSRLLWEAAHEEDVLEQPALPQPEKHPQDGIVSRHPRQQE